MVSERGSTERLVCWLVEGGVGLANALSIHDVLYCDSKLLLLLLYLKMRSAAPKITHAPLAGTAAYSDGPHHHHQ
jgi:hypothetical protein